MVAVMVTESPEFEVSSDNVVFVVSDSVTVVVVAVIVAEAVVFVAGPPGSRPEQPARSMQNSSKTQMNAGVFIVSISLTELRSPRILKYVCNCPGIPLP
jgi:L-fucose isomerase-like protein